MTSSRNNARWNCALAPGVSDMIDKAIKMNSIPLASSSRLCKICFAFLMTTRDSRSGVCIECEIEAATQDSILVQKDNMEMWITQTALVLGDAKKMETQMKMLENILMVPFLGVAKQRWVAVHAPLNGAWAHSEHGGRGPCVPPS